MKREDDTIKEILQRIKANLEDHQGCTMDLGLTQSLIKDCKKALRLIDQPLGHHP